MPQIPIPDPPVRTTIDDPLPQPLIVEIRLYTSPVAKAVLVAGLAFLGYWWVKLTWLMKIQPQLSAWWDSVR
ncbi:MAG: hypothetical protein IPK66_18945 [Rhodospirillales bacterium]|nr:hypothetical protein [Rhodospirillales bacterium]